MVEASSFAIFAGTSHPEFASKVAKGLKTNLNHVSIQTFPDEEIGIEILDNVRGRDAFVLQTIARRPNHYLMEMLIFVDALKRASCRSITAVMPYFGYARQDRRDKGRVPITAKLVADLLQTAGVDRVLTMDLHAEQIQGFFDIPVDHLLARPVQTKYTEKWDRKGCVVVAPDLGSIKLARAFAHDIEADFAIVDKRRITAERVEPGALIGSVEGKEVFIIDDMVSTGSTLKTAARVCKEAGAKKVMALATHGLLVEDAFLESAIEKLIVTDTIPLPAWAQNHPKVEVISVAPLFSQAIDSILLAQSLSSLQDS